MDMLLTNKNAVIYGAGGAIGSAIAHAFAREGARGFLTGRRMASVDAVAREILDGGGRAQMAQVAALHWLAIAKDLGTGAPKGRMLGLRRQRLERRMVVLPMPLVSHSSRSRLKTLP